jgi:hypothetical protein
MSQGVIATPSSAASSSANASASPPKKKVISLADLLASKASAPQQSDPKPSWNSDFVDEQSLRPAYIGSINDQDSPPKPVHKSGVSGMSLARSLARNNPANNNTTTDSMSNLIKLGNEGPAPVPTDYSSHQRSHRHPQSMSDFLGGSSQPAVAVPRSKQRLDPASLGPSGARTSQPTTMSDYVTSSSQPPNTYRTTPKKMDPAAAGPAGVVKRGGTMADYLNAQAQPDVAVRHTPKKADPSASQGPAGARVTVGNTGNTTMSDYLTAKHPTVETPVKINPANVAMPAGRNAGRGTTMADFLQNKAAEAGEVYAYQQEAEVEDEVETQRKLWAKFGMSPPAKEAYNTD